MEGYDKQGKRKKEEEEEERGRRGRDYVIENITLGKKK